MEMQGPNLLLQTRGQIGAQNNEGMGCPLRGTCWHSKGKSSTGWLKDEMGKEQTSRRWLAPPGTPAFARLILTGVLGPGQGEREPTARATSAV